MVVEMVMKLIKEGKTRVVTVMMERKVMKWLNCRTDVGESGIGGD